ncbi:unnamed protein product [Tilletia laevis]|uniref:Phenylalanine ammonia-lyase n=2 Tax=Tilletia TaxID=13289 RepID=A0A177VA20_9BASI|nr:hypothetical protein CF336_g2494 [Tilletia laevis]KAE8265753.1 hypothetical protein A4X03_0g59 [Tilletia caries]KAE8206708.1 hypothetical protein CF335_g1675 [Tilletia laevis]CAD6885424.1 unnamed protein product [Tilletia caries]CAD6896303.1 unnamed protein product [Tilletia caries]
MSSSRATETSDETTPRSRILGSIVSSFRRDRSASKSKASLASDSNTSSSNLSNSGGLSRSISLTQGRESGALSPSPSELYPKRPSTSANNPDYKLSLPPRSADHTHTSLLEREPTQRANMADNRNRRASLLALPVPAYPTPTFNSGLGHREMVRNLLCVIAGSSHSFNRVQIDGATLRLAEFVAISRFGAACEPHVGRKPELARSRDALQATVDAGHVVYGTNTMFGGNAASRSDPLKVQHALTGLLCGILPAELTLAVTVPFTPPTGPSLYDGGSTSGGTGGTGDGGNPALSQFASTVAQSHALPTAWVRGAMLLRLNNFLRGSSAVRWECVDTLTKMIAEEITPLVPSQGSISASGDLSPLAYIAFAMAGNSGVQVLKGRGASSMLMPSAIALRSASISPLTFSPKEVLAVTNGTSVACSVAAHTLADAHVLMILAQLVSAANAEAMMACRDSFDAFLSDECRPHPGQIEIAANLRSFLIGSCFTHAGKQPSSPLARCLQLALDLSDAEAEQLAEIGEGFFLQQDRYPFRTAPQWLGPPLEDLMHAHRTLSIELNSASDNPLVDCSSSKSRILHGGNFQALSVTNATEKVRDVASYVGRILFAQQEELINPALSCGLPSNLTLGEPSTEGGFKGVSIGCAALTSELGYLASRAGHFVQSAEMHNQSLNSLALISARSTASSVETLTKMLCNSMIMACQALDLRTCFISHLQLLAFEISQWLGLGDGIKPLCSVSVRAGSVERNNDTDIRLRQRALHKLMAVITLALMRHTSLDSDRRATIAAKEGALAMLETELREASRPSAKEKTSSKTKRNPSPSFGDTLLAGAQLYLQSNRVPYQDGSEQRAEKTSSDSFMTEIWGRRRTTSDDTPHSESTFSFANPFAIASATASCESFRSRSGETTEAKSDCTKLYFQVLEPALAHVIQSTFERSRDAYFRASRREAMDLQEWDHKAGARKRAAQWAVPVRDSVTLPTSPLPYVGKGAAALYKMVRFQFGLKMHRTVAMDQPGFENARARSASQARRRFGSSDDEPLSPGNEGQGFGDEHGPQSGPKLEKWAKVLSNATLRASADRRASVKDQEDDEADEGTENARDDESCNSDEEELEGPRRTLGEELSLLYETLRDPRKLLSGIHEVLHPDR